MKVIERRKGFLLCAAAIVLSMFAGCASGPEILDDKGAMSVATPKWIDAYLSGGNLAVEKLDEYKDNYCFVISDEGRDKDFIVAWTSNVDGPREIASLIATSVQDNAQAKISGSNGDEIERGLTVTTEILSNASYTGVRKVADWWRFIRTRSTREERYQAYVLYIGAKKSINDQIVRNIQNIIDNNKAMSEAEQAIYADIMDDIRRNGLFN
ncbi:hypothetical protein AGMMS49587_02710 [Spirochaetia bacterium]|nr:hypothetical protein AGMMS49587_02710 [Spirochaetia bacterium]